MAGEINFGLLDPNGPAKIGNALFQGQQDQAQLQAAQNQNKLTGISIQDHQRALNDQIAMTNAIRGNVDPSTGQVNHQGVMKTLAQNGSGHLVQQYYNNVLANQKTAADVSKTNADTATNAFDLKTKKYNQAIHDIASFDNPQQAIESVKAHSDSGEIDPLHAQAVIQGIPQDPVEFKKWQISMIKTTMDAKERMKYEAPDANTVANNATSIANTKANIRKDLAVSGIGQDGQPNASTQSMVDAIGQYKVQPPNGMALRNPRMQGILAEVTKQYPDFDATTYGARQQAVKSFSTGKDGQSVQSANTALNHLETLKELADAQNNGDVRLFNQIANKISTETGGAAPTNLQGAITMVGPEISKAVVGAGGTGGDREKVDSALQALVKGGPAQAAGQIATMKDLFGGRLSEAKRTYERTTGRKDFESSLLSPAAQAVLSARNGQTPTQISTDADYAKLPSGAEFIAPDGSHRRKP